MAASEDTARTEPLDSLYRQVNRMAHDLPGPLRRVRVRAGEVTIEVEWQAAGTPAAEPLATTARSQPAGAVLPAAPAEGELPVGGPVAGESVLASPMVGTFYRAGSPAEPPFVEVGDLVEEGQTVGVIEAMKLFNPITADFSGVVVEILVKDAETVEYAQPILRLAAGQHGQADAEDR